MRPCRLMKCSMCSLKWLMILLSVMILAGRADEPDGQHASMAYLLDKAEHIDPQRIESIKNDYHEFIAHFDQNSWDKLHRMGSELIELGKIIGMGVVAAISYGIINDLISTHINFDYFKDLHLTHHGRVTLARYPFVYDSQSRILYSLLWGTIATWWLGLPIGVLSAAAARLGSSTEKRTWHDLVNATLVMMGGTLAGSLLSAGMSYLVFRSSFFAVAAMHNSAYLLALISGLTLPLVIWDTRPIVKTSSLEQKCDKFSQELVYLFNLYPDHPEVQALVELLMNSPYGCSHPD